MTGPPPCFSIAKRAANVFDQLIARAEQESVPRAELVGNLRRALAAQKEWRERRRLVDRGSLLGATLNHVRTHVPFYRSALREHRGKDAEQMWQALPLIDKTTVVGDFHRFLSEQTLSSEIFERETSGTLGTKARLRYDLPAWFDCGPYAYESLCSSAFSLRRAIRSGEAAIVNIMNYPTRADTTYILPNLGLAFSRTRQLARGETRDFALVEELRETQPALIASKPSCFLRLAELDAQLSGRRIRPKAIMSSAECLHPDQRLTIEQAFACPIYNTYASTEGGVIARECDHHRGLHLSSMFVQLHVIPDGRDDVPSAAVLGEEGALKEEGSGELVLTNLVNWATPLLKYRTGDWATLRRAKCPCGYEGISIFDLRGKEAQSFSVRGMELSPSAVSQAIAAFPIKAHQVIAAGDELRLRFEPKHASGNEQALKMDIHAALRERFPDVPFVVEATEWLPAPEHKVVRYHVLPQP